MMLKLLHDPRTVARDVPGLFDAVFPQLTSGVVTYFNKKRIAADVTPVAADLIAQSKLQKAMLFELGVAAGEMLLSVDIIDREECKRVALARQRRHFDAVLPNEISDVDRTIAEQVGRNIATMISGLSVERGQTVTVAPLIPGLRWISSGRGDFSAGPSLVEVKCANKNFSAADYRQIVLYWLLGYAAALENRGQEWSEGILLNPRSGKYVAFDFDELLHVISAGRTKVEVLQVFASMVDNYGLP
jgi:hypothetical protein